MYHKRLVVDIDDTVSFTTNRDWENAKPNYPLITKLNELYDKGWEICFYTARGHVSFSGDREAAKNHYEPIILEWFKKHGVKYTELSFDKPLAAYYIDDKGITPEDFLDLNITELHGGLSGAYIERRGDRVYKTAENSLESAVWYNEAKNIVPTVKVHSLIGDTICMDFLQETSEPKLHQIEDVIEKFRAVPASNNFGSYITRLRLHLNEYYPDYAEFLMRELKLYSEVFNKEKSFCHGDMSLDNMINQDGTLYLIDPNRPSSLYSSWLLDASKVMASSIRFNKPHVREYFLSKYFQYERVLLLLEITHFVRMRKYAKEAGQDVNYIDNNIETLLREYKEL